MANRRVIARENNRESDLEDTASFAENEGHLPDVCRLPLEPEEPSRYSIAITSDQSMLYLLKDGIVVPAIQNYGELIRIARQYVDKKAYLGLFQVGLVPDDDVQIHKNDPPQLFGQRLCIVFKARAIPKKVHQENDTLLRLAISGSKALEKNVSASSPQRVIVREITEQDEENMPRPRRAANPRRRNEQEERNEQEGRTEPDKPVGGCKLMRWRKHIHRGAGSYLNAFLEHMEVPNENDCTGVVTRICPATMNDKCYGQFQRPSEHWKWHVGQGTIPPNWDSVASALEQQSDSLHTKYRYVRTTDIERALESNNADDRFTAVTKLITMIGHFVIEDRHTVGTPGPENLIGAMTRDTRVRPFMSVKMVELQRVDNDRTDTQAPTDDGSTNGD